jgi:hypothetical protein
MLIDWGKPNESGQGRFESEGDCEARFSSDRSLSAETHNASQAVAINSAKTERRTLLSVILPRDHFNLQNSLAQSFSKAVPQSPPAIGREGERLLVANA